MKKLILIIALSGSLVIYGHACICLELNKERVDEMKYDSDIIFTGTVIGSNDWNPYTVERCDAVKRGNDVIIRVDSVLKGAIEKNDLVFIYQSAGSCTETYNYDSGYLIFSKEIKAFQKIKNQENVSMDAPPPPPDYLSLNHKGTFETNADTSIVNFLKSQLDKYTVVDTNMCQSFSINSSQYKKVFSLLRK